MATATIQSLAPLHRGGIGMTENKCTGDHSVHVCELANQKKFKQIKQLAQDPYYMCINCGRVADSENNLCNPLAFDKIPIEVPG